MTDGHTHRHLRIKTFDAWWVRLLRTPVRHSTNTRAVDESPYPYGVCVKHRHVCWTLTPLGILHRWTGLTLDSDPKQ